MSGREVDEWFKQLTGEMHTLSDELGNIRPRVASARFWEPRIDVIEEKDRFLLKAEIAGVRGEDIQLLYISDRHSLVIRGFRSEGDLTDGERQGVHQLEIYYGDFQREIRLPDAPIVHTEIRAQYKNGFLYVLVPKQQVAKINVRTISVKKI